MTNEKIVEGRKMKRIITRNESPAGPAPDNGLRPSDGAKALVGGGGWAVE